MIKIPGTDEGLPGDRADDLRGHATSTSRCCSASRHTRRSPRPTSAGCERRHEEGKSLDVHSVASFFVSRVDTEVDKRLEELGATTSCWARPAWPTRAPPTSASRRSSTASASPTLRAAGAPCSARCGRRPASRTPSTPTRCTSTGSIGAGDRQHDADGDAAGGRPSAPRSAARPPTRTRRADLAGARRRRHRHRRRHRQAAARRRRRVRHADGEAARRHRVQARGDRHRPPGDDRGVAARRARAGDRARASDAPPTSDVARRIWRKDDTLWGAGGHAGGRQPARLADDQRDACARRPTTSMAFAAQAVADGLTDGVLLGMGGSSLAPEVLRRSFGDQAGRAAPARARLDRRRRGARTSRTRSTPTQTLFLVSTQVRRDDRDAVAVRALLGAAGRDGAHFVAITDPGSRAGGRSPPSTASARVFLNDPDIGGRYSALSYFGLVPAALMGADVERAARRRRRRPSRRAAHYDDARRNSGPVARAARSASWRCRPRQADVRRRRRRSRRFGLWVEQLVAESTGKQGKGIAARRRRAARRAGRLRRRPRLRPPARRGRPDDDDEARRGAAPTPASRC